MSAAFAAGANDPGISVSQQLVTCGRSRRALLVLAGRGRRRPSSAPRGTGGTQRREAGEALPAAGLREGCGETLRSSAAVSRQRDRLGNTQGHIRRPVLVT